MKFKTDDTVWYIRENRIYRGVVEDECGYLDNLSKYYGVRTQFGLFIIADHELYLTREALVDDIDCSESTIMC